jgi:hypothetical protein
MPKRAGEKEKEKKKKKKRPKGGLNHSHHPYSLV